MIALCLTNKLEGLLRKLVRRYSCVAFRELCLETRQLLFDVLCLPKVFVTADSEFELMHAHPKSFQFEAVQARHKITNSIDRAKNESTSATVSLAVPT